MIIGYVPFFGKFMKCKKILLILCICVIVLIIIVTEYVIYCGNSRKGGRDTLSVFEINSSELRISNEKIQSLL